jgi:hypothetical protein
VVGFVGLKIFKGRRLHAPIGNQFMFPSSLAQECYLRTPPQSIGCD